MAEYTEVMRQARRMCVAINDCEKCPVVTMTAGCYLKLSPQFVHGDDIAEVERIVMQWAAEHPEPKYPSWNKGWNKLFPNAVTKVPPCPKHFLDNARWDSLCDGRACSECLNSSIPADIAERLGIKPIGGKEE